MIESHGDTHLKTVRHSHKAFWLPCFGGAFIIAGGPLGFSVLPVPADAARVNNRQYLVQHQNSLSVRYMIADDELLDEDLAWAGYRFERQTTRGVRWLKPKPSA